MFTGIIEETGRVRSIEGDRYTFDVKKIVDDAAIGDSISVNGCCLTVVELAEQAFAADVVDETKACTTLPSLSVGSLVNLERPVRLQDRLGGHLVQGHVDAIGEVVAPAPDLRVRVPSRLLRYIVAKGSIAIDGVSLTVAELHDDGFRVAIIPHTSSVTTLGERGVGDTVNLEVDVMAKYAERLLQFIEKP